MGAGSGLGQARAFETPLGGPININDFASGNGNFDPKTGQMNTVGQTTAANASAPYMPIMGANASNPNTPTLGTGQTANPYQGSTNPYIQAAQATTMGNLYGSQAATQANRMNQNTPYGSLNYTQGVDANGNPTWTANQQLSQPLQDLTNTSLSGLQQSLQNPMYGINPGQTYSDAIMQRLAPQLAQQSESNTAALANQGIVPGTQAYENAMRTFQQGQNDLRTSAQIQGMNTGLQAQQLQNQQAANIKALGSPGYVNPYSQPAVAGPDYLGAYTTSRAAEIAQQNANIAKQNATTQGLYGLGSAALLGSGGLGSLGTGGTGGSGLLGLGGSAYNTLFGNSGLNNPFVNSADYMNNIGAYGSEMFDPAMSSNEYLTNLYGDIGIF
tara:strand:+ start:3032 stop:4186 length:1155 start_codon:yes stop_codon:yes gene_type:complete